MALTADEKKVLTELQKAINAMRREYDSIDPATDYDKKLDAGEAYRKLVSLQNQLLQTAMDRDIQFTSKELAQIEKIGSDIRDAAKKQQRIKLALKLFGKLVLK